MIGDNSMTDAQAKTCPDISRFGREEGIHHLIYVLWRYSCPKIKKKLSGYKGNSSTITCSPDILSILSSCIPGYFSLSA